MDHSVNDERDFEAHIASLAAHMAEPDRSNLERYLRANPGNTARDWDGKGPSLPPEAEPWEEPWNRLNAGDVRSEAVRYFARELPQNLRQAAARDPGLIWNNLARKYRERLPSDPPADGRGPEKFDVAAERTGAGH